MISEKSMKAVDIVINTVLVLSVFVVGLSIFAAYKENDLKEKFDIECKSSGGIPLRSTYHYDPVNNKIHYVCLKQTSVMDIE